MIGQHSLLRPSRSFLALAALFVATLASVAVRPAAADPLEPKPVKIKPGSGPSAPVELLGVEGKGWLERRAGNLVLHVAGTPYEMGYQHGVLLRQQIRGLLAHIELMAEAQKLLEPNSPPLPKLKEAYERCLPHIPKEYIEEMRGLAKGAGQSFDDVRTANMIPELFHCSGFALWGRATQGGVLYHGRILDYAMEIGYHNFAVLIVARPEGRHAFVNVGYAGFLGSVTGTNERQVSFGEMGGGGTGLWDGMPMAFLMRKGLEDADTLDEGVAIFRDTPRTCEYYYVISDAKVPSARGLACRPDKFLVLNPGDPNPELPVPVGVLDTILMSGGDRFRLLTSRVVTNYSRFDGPAALALMRRPVAMKSAIHTALFAPGVGKLWVSNAVKATPASEMPYTEYDTRELLAATSPAGGPASPTAPAAPAAPPVTPGQPGPSPSASQQPAAPPPDAQVDGL
ncbi:MAG: peptidase C45 [Planctomycetes bacterium]|nr:peptidase C45 [Planctomycetota bacterium]